MSRVILNSLWLTPMVLGAATFAANAQVGTQPATSDASVLNQISVYGAEGRSNQLNAVTSVSQFTDVRPTDWAFQALQSLVERYGCIVGYPDRTYRGNRALTRYEFAAGLNACLDKIQELIAAATADFVRKEDLEVVKRLQEEFAAELAALRGRVEALEVRTATLEKQQFSTTTKLSGEVIFAVADTFGDRAVFTGNDQFVGSGVTNQATRNNLEDDRTETIFGYRARLALDSSFSGRDQLRVRLQGRNITPFDGAFTGTRETRLGFDGTQTSVDINQLFYRFPIGDNLRIQIDGVEARMYSSVLSVLTPFESSGSGALSRFGRFSPIFRTNDQTNTGSPGIAFDYRLGRNFNIQGGYFADRQAGDPGRANGLFNGNYSAIGQLVFRPSSAFDISVAYARSYFPGSNLDGRGLNTATGNSNPFGQPAPNLFGSTGTGYAINPFNGEPTTADTFGAQLQWRLGRSLTIGGWYNYTFAYNARPGNGEEAKIQNWAGFLAFPDLGKRGNLGGIIFGMTPRVVDTDYRPRRTGNFQPGTGNPNLRRRLDEDPPFHLEALYRYRITDNIAITPGVIVLFNPEGNAANDTQFVGVVRTTFTF